MENLSSFRVADPSSSRVAIQRGLPIALGFLLLLAPLLKVWSQLRHPQPLNGSLLDHPAIAGPVAAFEAALGLVLIARLWPRWAWHAAIVVFGLFTIITAIEAAQGKDSCGCFGAVNVKPIYMMCLDIAAVSALLVTGRPKGRGSGVGGRGSGRRRRIVAGGIGMPFFPTSNQQPATTNLPIAYRNMRVTLAATLGAAWLVAVGMMWLTRPTIAAPTMTALGQDFGKPGELVVLEPEKWAGQAGQRPRKTPIHHGKSNSSNGSRRIFRWNAQEEDRSRREGPILGNVPSWPVDFAMRHRVN